MRAAVSVSVLLAPSGGAQRAVSDAEQPSPDQPACNSPVSASAGHAPPRFQTNDSALSLAFSGRRMPFSRCRRTVSTRMARCGELVRSSAARRPCISILGWAMCGGRHGERKLPAHSLCASSPPSSSLSNRDAFLSSSRITCPSRKRTRNISGTSGWIHVPHSSPPLTYVLKQSPPLVGVCM